MVLSLRLARDPLCARAETHRRGCVLYPCAPVRRLRVEDKVLDSVDRHDGREQEEHEGGVRVGRQQHLIRLHWWWVGDQCVPPQHAEGRLEQQVADGKAAYQRGGRWRHGGGVQGVARKKNNLARLCVRASLLSIGLKVPLNQMQPGRQGRVVTLKQGHCVARVSAYRICEPGRTTLPVREL